MPVNALIQLFFKPACELNKEGEAIEAEEIRALGEELYERLCRIARAIDLLTKHGWEATMMLYDVCLTHSYIDTEEEARARLEELGLDPAEFCIMEMEEEEWEEDGFEGEQLEADFEDEEFEGEVFEGDEEDEEEEFGEGFRP